MDFLRLYLGEFTVVFILLVILSILFTAISRLFPEDKLIRQIRNWVLVGVVGVFFLGLIPSLVVNNTPRGKIDRTDIDRDQKTFEQRHSGDNK